jgi:hypothetical protein
MMAADCIEATNQARLDRLVALAPFLQSTALFMTLNDDDKNGH